MWLVRAAALLAAAAGKSLHPVRFRDSIEHGFPSIVRTGPTLAAGAILAGEAAVGLLMLAGGELSRIGLMLALVLFVSLTLVVVVVRGSSANGGAGVLGGLPLPAMVAIAAIATMLLLLSLHLRDLAQLMQVRVEDL